jgi:serine/threonine protein kinase/tetratricopeptide (TPR) repeat protein
MIGQTISHYKILEKLGEGGMGVVYKAHDTKLDRLVALKFLPQQITVSEDDKARFLQEAKAASAVMHPNVCVIHDIQEHQGQQFIVMEYVDGKTLRQTVPVQKTQTAIDYAIQIGEALQEAHSKGVVHRDIKTDNIMVNSKNQIKVMDFGLAKLKGSLKLTKTSSTVGTLAYMAPEQIEGGEVDARSDIFSFGVLLYEMLTGHLPFRGEHEAAMLYSIVNEDPTPIDKYLPEVSSELVHILNRALEKDPENRYQFVHEMVIDLRRLKKETTRVVRSTTDGTAEPSGYLSGFAHKSTRWLWTAAGTVVALLLSLYFIFIRQSEKIESIAVMPCSIAMADSSIEHLSDDLTESIISSLSPLPMIKVKSYNVVARYKGKDVSPEQAGHELGVDAVVIERMSLRKDQLSLTVELVDTRTGNQIWGHKYTESLAGVVNLQPEILRDIAQKLQLKLSGEEQRRLLKKSTENPEAYQLYAKGRFYLNKRTSDGIDSALANFQQAVMVDPNYARAYVAIAESYIVGFTFHLSPKTCLERAKKATLQALELDRDLAEAHAAKAALLGYYEYDSMTAEEEFRRAIELNPNFPTAHHWFAEYLIAVLGRFEEGFAEYRRAKELDPTSLAILTDYALGFFFARQYDRAIEELQKVNALDSTFVRTHFYLAVVYWKRGMNDASFQALTQGMIANGRSAAEIEQFRRVYRTSGLKGVAHLWLQRGMQDRRTAGSPHSILWSSIIVGDRLAALTYLERMYSEREAFVADLKFDPTVDDLRNEPRFIAMLKKVGLEK